MQAADPQLLKARLWYVFRKKGQRKYTGDSFTYSLQPMKFLFASRLTQTPLWVGTE